MSARNCGRCGSPLDEQWKGAVCRRCLLADEPFDQEEERRLEFEERYAFSDEHPITGEEHPLARGGQGVLFRVEDRRLRRVIAFKRLKDEFRYDRAARSRFCSEAQVSGRLDHPGFLPVLDFGEDPQGRLYFTTILLKDQMTFAKLVQRIHQGSDDEWTLRRGLEVLLQVGEALSYAHEQNIFHRDLKPDNVMIGNHGEVFVIDLGAAKAPPSSGSEPQAPPEQDAADLGEAPELVR